MKTIDIQAKEWFDRVNGNSYFSIQITLDFGTKKEQKIYVPMEYGYGDYYMDKAKTKLIELRKLILKGRLLRSPLTYICRQRKIILRYSKQEKCLKRDVIHWGME